MNNFSNIFSSYKTKWFYNFISLPWFYRYIKFILINKIILFLAVFPAYGAMNGIEVEINKPAVFQEKLDKNSTSTEILFELPSINESRLQIQLRVPLLNTDVSLIDPTGHTIIGVKDDQISVQRSSVLKKPELGNLIRLPELHDPQSGIWKLHLTHLPAIGNEIISATIFLNERFFLYIRNYEQHASAGQPIILEVLAADYGKELIGLSPQIKVWHNDKPLDTYLTASESLTSPDGTPVSRGSGNYLANYILPFSGSYAFVTRIEFSGRDGSVVKTAKTFMEVESEQVSLRRLEVRPILGLGDCVKKIDFLVELSIKKPGTYVLALFLNTHDGQDIELSASEEGEAGLLTYQISLDTRKVRQQLVTTSMINVIKSIDVLHFDTPGVTLVRRYESRQIEPSISLEKLCK